MRAHILALAWQAGGVGLAPSKHGQDKVHDSGQLASDVNVPGLGSLYDFKYLGFMMASTQADIAIRRGPIWIFLGIILEPEGNLALNGVAAAS